MRKYLIAASLGAMLLAGQAAASDSAVVSLGDRIGSPTDSSSQFQGMEQNQLLLILLTGGAAAALIIWGFTQVGRGSQIPSSP